MPGARKGESGLRALPPPRGLTALFHSAFWLEAENGSRAPPVGQDCDGQPGFVILGVGRCRCGYQPMRQPQMCGARRGRSQSPRPRRSPGRARTFVLGLGQVRGVRRDRA